MSCHQPDPDWVIMGDETEEYDHEDDGLYIPDAEEC